MQERLGTPVNIGSGFGLLSPQPDPVVTKSCAATWRHFGGNELRIAKYKIEHT